MPGPVGEDGEEGRLRATIAFAEGMDRVECRDERRRLGGKYLPVGLFPVPPSSERSEGGTHFPIDMLGIAKRAPIFADADSAEAPRPGIDVLKQVMVDGAIMADGKATARQRLIGALRCHDHLEFIEGSLIADAGDILKDGRTVVAVRVCHGVVHGVRLALRDVFARELTAAFLRREALPVELAEVAFHATARAEALNGADLGEAAPAEGIGASTLG